MSASITNIQSAPRTLEGLCKLQAYPLRQLVADLKGLDTVEQKDSWHSSTPTDRAKFVLSLLQAWDAANPGGAHVIAPSETVRTPVTNGTVAPAAPPPTAMSLPALPTLPAALSQPMAAAPPQPVQPAQVPIISQEAISAAQAATAVDKPKRQPRTSTSTSEAPIDNELGPKLVQVLGDLVAGVKGNADLLMKAHRFISEQSVLDRGDATLIHHRMDNIEATLKTITGVQWALLSTVFNMASEQLGASQADLLKMAIEDGANYQKHFSGKV